MNIKWLPLAILLIITLVGSIVVMVVFWDSTQEDCTENCDRPSIPRIVSLVSWFFAWEVGLIMLLHVSVSCMSTEAGGFLPTVTSVIMYCVASFIFFSGGFMLAGSHEYTPHANITASALNVTNKEETATPHGIKYIYHSVVMMAAVIGFMIYSLLVCGLMYTPKCDEEDHRSQDQKLCIIKAGCKSISTVAKELGRRIEKPRNLQVQA